jgi:hypothetical protein
MRLVQPLQPHSSQSSLLFRQQFLQLVTAQEQETWGISFKGMGYVVKLAYESFFFPP